MYTPTLLLTVTETTAALAREARRFRRSLQLSCGFAVCLWLVKLIESTCGFDFGHFGVYPGELRGLGGIILGPLIHGSWSHLASNTAPVVVLGTALLYGYPRAARIALPVLYVGPGIGVWLFARETFHIGASGLTFGMMFFVFAIGTMRWDRRAIALSMIVFFLYGGMIWGIFPHDPSVSFEYHLFGALFGIALAIAFKNADPAPPEKRYSWEEEDPDDAGDESNWQ